MNSYHIRNKSIEYARIPLDDVGSSNLISYFQAAADFIDQCNPRYITSSPQNRILIHCAAGISRSSSTVISYLIHRAINWNPMEIDCIDIIRKRLQYDKEADAIGGLDKLSFAVAYFHVKSCRSIIGPNEGFVEQLERFEKMQHNGKSTRSDLPDMFSWKIAYEDQEMYKQIIARRGKETKHSKGLRTAPVGAVEDGVDCENVGFLNGAAVGDVAPPEPRRKCIIL